MFASVLLPLVVAMMLAVGVTTVHRRLPPVLAARAVTVTVIVVVGAAVPTLWIVGFGYLAHVSILGRGFAWCAEFFGIHDRVPAWAGLPALGVAIIGTVRVARVLSIYRRLRHDQPKAVEVVEHPQPFAFTLPGRGGHVVLSSGIVDLLDDDERAVVLAHEQAHARHRHDRYLLVVQLAAAAVPLLRPLTARAQFSLERWADEAAVDQCGNRRFVAETLGKVALHTIAPAGVLGFAGLGVTARVAALLSPPPAAPRPLVLMGLWVAIGLTGVLAAFQVHHLAGLVTTLCPD
jgi:Zn-dependent protease with chaperone function